MNLKVINEIRDETKIFKTVEEFDIYYSKHKDEMNTHTTQYLNRVYKIDTNDGEYRITKKNCKKVDGKITDGDIYLKKVKTKLNDSPRGSNTVSDKSNDDDLTSLRFTSIEASVESNKTSINQLKTSIEQLTELVDDIKDKLNKVIQFINSQTNS